MYKRQLDISFFLDAGLKPEDWLPRYAPRLKGIHIRDHHATKEVVLGEGDLNLAAVARALHRANWSGWAILEVNKRTDRTSRKMIEDAHHYIEDKMKSL